MTPRAAPLGSARAYGPVFWVALAVLGACATAPAEDPTYVGPAGPAVGPGQDVEAAADPSGTPAAAAEAARPEPVEDPRPWSVRTLESMTLREKVGQMIMPWVYGDFAPEGSDSHQRVLGYVEDGVGGIIMSVGSPTEVAAKINDLQRHAKHPLLVAADLETGAGYRFRGAVQMPGTIELGGATDFPSLMAVGATREPGLAYEMGRVTALEARALGVHVPFAPVLDVNNNPDNPIINIRSFGEDPDLVSTMGVAFVRGVQEHGAVATGKHFPGHGDTDIDSHLALPTIPHSRARMDSVELKPFRAAVDAGMGAVMTAHITVPALNGGGSEPATLSGAVLTDLLRREMGFGGLVFTDAMDMRAISGRLGTGEAAVRAVEAGADVILMPPSVGPALEGILDAVCNGRIPEARIDASVRRLLELKEAMGLHQAREVPLEELTRRVGLPEHERLAEEVARKSITVVRNGGNLLPLRGTRTAQVLSITYRRESDVLAGRYFDQRLRQTYPRLRTAALLRDSGAGLYEGLLRQARRSALVVVSLHVTTVSFSGSVAIPEEVSGFVRALGEARIPHIVVSFGNPYLITEFPDVRAYVLAWSGSRASQVAAASALFGDFAITGRSPTAAPPFFRIGDGLQIPAKATTGGGR